MSNPSFGRNQELNFEYIKALKSYKKHCLTCKQDDPLEEMDEQQIKQYKKELKGTKRKLKEEYRNLRNSEEARVDEIRNLRRDVEEIEAETESALSVEQTTSGHKGVTSFWIPAGDQNYGNLESPVPATTEGYLEAIEAQKQVISSLTEKIENTRSKYGFNFEKLISDIRYEVAAMETQLTNDQSENTNNTEIDS